MPPLTEEELAYLRMILGQNADNAADLYPTVEKKVGDTNYLQDRVQMLGDPLLAGLGGPGGFAPGAFDPTLERNSVDAPGMQRQIQWQNAPSGSAMRTMADLMYIDDLDAGSAWNLVQKEVLAEPDGTVATSLGPNQRDNYGAEIPGSNLSTIYNQAIEMQENLASDPAGARYNDQTGGYYTEETSTPSAAAQAFIDAGLPLPTEEYRTAPGDLDFMNEVNNGLAGQRNDMNRAMGEMLSNNAAIARQGGGPQQGAPEGFSRMDQGGAPGAPGGTFPTRGGLGGPGGVGIAGTNQPGVRNGTIDPASRMTSNGTMLPYEYDAGGLDVGALAASPANQQGGGGGGWNPLEAPGAIADSINFGNAFDTPEGEGGGGGNPLDVIKRIFSGNISGGLAPGVGPDPSEPAERDRDSYFGKEFGGRSQGGGAADPRLDALRRSQQQEQQKKIFQGVGDRRDVRMQADPGDQMAINAYGMQGAREAGRSPLSDAVQRRMLLQQISGF
jgi:hypothetical protein